MPNAMPVVSIYLTTRNRGVLLRRALSSVFAQSLEDYELLIVDDCSSDDTADICSTICEADSRVRYLRTYQRSGAPYARNLATI
ncbi:MAG: glycosyltransferase family 2 protein [Gammaproteobacteria bacterium]|nr:glycosyltransferase family 2 protein [Gammaproteobacteria bacterium]